MMMVVVLDRGGRQVVKERLRVLADGGVGHERLEERPGLDTADLRDRAHVTAADINVRLGAPERTEPMDCLRRVDDPALREAIEEPDAHRGHGLGRQDLDNPRNVGRGEQPAAEHAEPLRRRLSDGGVGVGCHRSEEARVARGLVLARPDEPHGARPDQPRCVVLGERTEGVDRPLGQGARLGGSQEVVEGRIPSIGLGLAADAAEKDALEARTRGLVGHRGVLLEELHEDADLVRVSACLDPSDNLVDRAGVFGEAVEERPADVLEPPRSLPACFRRAQLAKATRIASTPGEGDTRSGRRSSPNG